MVSAQTNRPLSPRHYPRIRIIHCSVIYVPNVPRCTQKCGHNNGKKDNLSI